MRGNIQPKYLANCSPSFDRLLKRGLHFLMLLLIADLGGAAHRLLALCVDDFRFLTRGVDISRYFLHFFVICICRFFYCLKVFKLPCDIVDLCLSIGDLTGSAFFVVEFTLFLKHLKCIVHSANITVAAYKVGQLCGYGLVVALGGKRPLGKIYRSLKSVCIYAEQTLTKPLGEICGYSAGCGIVESVAVICRLGRKASLNTICLAICIKGKTSSANTATPGQIVLSVILLKACLFGVAHSVEHNLDKCRKCGLATAVVCSNTVEAVCKAEFLSAYFSEVFNIAFY